MNQPINIFWFRRDLRLDDNRGLFEALKSGLEVLPIFIFDQAILDKLPEDDARVTFIYETLQKMKRTLQMEYQSDIAIYYGHPLEVFKQLTEMMTVEVVYTNHDYEPYALQRDQQVTDYLETLNIAFKTYKDHVIFEKDNIVKSDGTPYVVYTPYMKQWKTLFKNQTLKYYDSKSNLSKLVKHLNVANISLSEMGFEKASQKVKDYKLTAHLIQEYEAKRNFPGLDATSKLGPHLRFGTISIRATVSKAASEPNEIFLQELIWREFFMQILYHFPHTATKSFKPKYDRIEWRNNEHEFKAWCEGKTGYPLVDAGMRQLNDTGFMHNRVRMMVGSFLCKHLLIDWRWGEAYFAEKLNDYEMASNVGNWQWVAGCGVDAAPYFRIFNPTSQLEKFDRDHAYINTWIKDLHEITYPKPIVDHQEARERCLKVYQNALN